MFNAETKPGAFVVPSLRTHRVARTIQGVILAELAEVLLHVLHRAKRCRQVVDEGQQLSDLALLSLLERRETHRPVAHVVGWLDLPVGAERNEDVKLGGLVQCPVAAEVMGTHHHLCRNTAIGNAGTNVRGLGVRVENRRLRTSWR